MIIYGMLMFIQKSKSYPFVFGKRSVKCILFNIAFFYQLELNCFIGSKMLKSLFIKYVCTD